MKIVTPIKDYRVCREEAARMTRAGKHSAADQLQACATSHLDKAVADFVEVGVPLILLASALAFVMAHT